MASEGASTERKTVVTYIPSYQKEQWTAHAEELGMSQSEYVRTMVQAGRRKFELPGEPPGDEERADGEESEAEETAAPVSDSPDQRFEHQIRDALSSSEYLSWDELLATLTDDIEGQLDETLQKLQAENEVQYSGRHGGYRLNTGGHAE